MNDETIEQPNDRPERMLRELEATVASHLGASERRPRGHAGRGRLIGAVSLAGAERATVLLVHTALAASRLLRRPVLLLDLTDSVGVPSYARELPGLTDLVSQPGLLAHHDAFAHGLGAQVAVARAGTGPEPAAPAIVDLLTELSRRYALVIVHSAPGAAARAALAQAADATIAIGIDREAGMLRRARLPGERDVIVLSDGPTPATEGATNGATEGDRQQLMDACRANVLAVVPGETIPLIRDDAGAGREPWRAIDRIARHMLQRTVGLALGAGASGAYAHLGVMTALAEAGVTIDFLAASGIGAPVATGAALGMAPDALRAHLDTMFRQLARPRLPWAAPGDDAALRAGFDALTGGRTFEDLDTPLGLIATDLDRGESVLLHQGALADAMLASMAMPGILGPIERDGRRFVDGGVLNPVPADVLGTAGADVVIGVRLAPAVATPGPDGGWRSRMRQPAVESVVRAFDLMQARLAGMAGGGADLTITPELRGPTGLRDWAGADDLIAAGHAAAEAVLPRLRARLALTDAAMPERIAA